ncbi:rhamnosyltransferase [Microbacterium trichothecenolyticum]|uniref:rhamnan synthesis F family protein n=1 Tax=Microbacterium trichothecenolyticum TaxID=69370 RepID=UPI0028659D83|nr:rhamnan synthesis F family protein [Microbacterium trichothecenolyticum]MDR7185311.1 rhamnosyltransferase [Microbacterium trichothecenolyticum]
MTHAVASPAVFPADGRRLVVYVVYDRRGDVDRFIPVALSGLREHAAHVIVVVNGSLTPEGRARLEPVADDILVRDNRGFDIWAHREALDHIGDRLAEFDEVLLTNDTWFGPVRPYSAVFDRMNAKATHFWGMTDHAREEPNPFTHKGVLPYHLQSFWIAVRREMFLSDAWSRYWRDLPKMPGYFDAVLKHEAVFTERFAQEGFVHDVAFASTDYPTDHPALFNSDLLLDDGCPLIKRRPLFHYPPFLDRHAVIGRQLLQKVADYGYPIEVVWENLARNVPPKTLNADAGMLEVLSSAGGGYDPTRQLRVVVIAHLADTSHLGILIDHLAQVEEPYDLVFTVAGAAAARAIGDHSNRLPPAARSCEVRVVADEAGGHMSAFFVDCADVLLGDDHDVVVKVHTDRLDAASVNGERYFSRYLWDNTVGSPGSVRSALALFQREEGLGMVFPAVAHVGFSLMGDAWGPFRPEAEKLSEELGIRVPLDGASPLMPLGGMWIARREALRVFADAGWTHADYRNGRWSDLAALQERLIVHAVAEVGGHARTVITPEHAAISHNSLEYKFDQLASTTPGYPIEQIAFLRKAGPVGRGNAFSFARMYVRMNHPSFYRRIEPVMGIAAMAVRAGRRTVRGAIRTLGRERRSA